MTSGAGRRAALNARLAAFGLLLALAAFAADPLGVPRVGGNARPSVSAVIDGETLTLAFDRPLDASALAPGAFRLSLNGGPPLAGRAIEGASQGTHLLRVAFPEGAGSADVARMGYLRPAGGPDLPFPGQGLDVRVATEEGALPGARLSARAAIAGENAYVIGGTSADSVPPDPAPLGSILRVDLATGATRTMSARLPRPLDDAAVAWDPRPWAACPTGCAYVFGGRAGNGEVVADVLRYDPASDTVEALPARLPIPAAGLAAVWTGGPVHVLGGEQPLVLRFDPEQGILETVGASAWTAARGMAAVFDPRGAAGCPAGCAYFFGGYASRPTTPAGDAMPYGREAILRLDPSTGRVERLSTAFPQALDAPAAAWAGERAIIAGGLRCRPLLCEISRDAWTFDPRAGTLTLLEHEVEVAIRDGVAAWSHGEVVLVAGALGRPPGETLGLDRVLRYRPDG